MKLIPLVACLLTAPLAAAAAKAKPQACVDKLLREAAKSKAEPGKEVPEDLRWSLLALYKWKAFGSGKKTDCAPLKVLRFSMDTRGWVGGDRLCLDLFHRLAFVRAYVERRPDLEEVCYRNVVNEGNDPDAAQLARYRMTCKLLVDFSLPVQERCERAVSYMPFPPEKRPKHIRRCLCDVASMAGKDDCKGDPGNARDGFLGPHRYDSLAAFHRAHAASDPEVCGDLELCRGLMGQGEKLSAAAAESIAAQYCP